MGSTGKNGGRCLSTKSVKFRYTLTGAKPPGTLSNILRIFHMNKLLAALVAGFFAVGAFAQAAAPAAAPAAKPAAAAPAAKQ